MPDNKRTKQASGKVVQKPSVKSSSKTTVSNLSALSTKQPIPFEGGLGFSYINSNEYLPFLSTDDKFAQMLLEYRLLSATHNACVTTKRDFCAGSGFRMSDGSEIDKDMLAWLNSLNVKDETAKEISKQLNESFWTFGNVPIELVRLTVGRKRFFYVYVHNFLEWRLGIPDQDDDVVKYAIQSKLFLRNGVMLTAEEMNKVKTLPLYSPRNRDTAKGKATPGYNWVTTAPGVERTMIWYKNSVSGFSHYGLPSSISSLIYQILEYKGARYNLDNFENNMVVSAILALKGSISQGEADKIGRKAINSYTGDGKRGRVAVVASEEGIDSSSLHNFDTHKDGSFKESDLVWSEKIILANQWDAVLAGIISPSSLGKGSAFISKILEMKKNTVIRPAQADQVDRVWGKIFNLAGAWLGNFKVDTSLVEINDTVDISGLTDVDITPTVTVDEVRSSKGMTPLADKKKGAMLLGELGNEQKKGVYVKDTSTKKKKKDVSEE